MQMQPVLLIEAANKLPAVTNITQFTLHGTFFFYVNNSISMDITNKNTLAMNAL